MSRRRLVVIPMLAALGAAAIAVPISSGADTETVKIVDYDFKPKSLTVPSGTRIKWKWSHASMAPHNVHLIKAPKHVKHFKGGKGKHDRPTHYRKPFVVKLTKPGTYKFTCDLHTFMKLKIKVTK